MSFKLGNTNIGELYVGSNKIAQAYLGSNLVYQSTGPGPTPSFDEVTIGTQTWMSKNLAVDDGGEGIYIRDRHNVNGVDLGTQYYYTWDAAERVANSIDGWHLPSQEEWNTLFTYVGSDVAGIKLKANYCWYGNEHTDDYGFTLLPVGKINEDGSDSLVGGATYLWTSLAVSPYGIGYTINAYSDYFGNGTTYMTIGYSVRLIKD
jgi:uncharacterized protein (TIGR02145 family)